MQVLKRNGTKENVSFDKITTRIRCLQNAHQLNQVNPVLVAQKVINGIYDGVKTSDLDELAAETCAYMSSENLEYGKLAAAIAVSNLHKNTTDDFLETLCDLPNIAHEFIHCAKEFQKQIQSALNYRLDYNLDYFGFRTLQRAYLMKGSKWMERPQHMFMRCALGIHPGNVLAMLETYHHLSQGFFIHATPTLFNACTVSAQLASCFLLSMKEDSITGIFDTLKQCAVISKHAGGIGLSVSDIRATGSKIKGTNGVSNGLVPMLKVFNDTSRYVNQGGKRPGAFAVYLEPWHADIFDFLQLKKNTGKEEHRARDLFYALWIPDLFMRRVQEDGKWSLFCPAEAPDLDKLWGDQFEALYHTYENDSKLVRRTVQAKDLWFAIIESQIETGNPYMLYKDACNSKSNQRNIGTIRCSNLCTEILEYTSPSEIAVCNLASIALPKFVNDGGIFDFWRLEHVTKIVTRNLNKIIDSNFYPLPEAKLGNKRRRPIGIGVQGLADVFAMMGLPFDCLAARKLNGQIFECIYYAALEASNDLARESKSSYEGFVGSPLSEGKLQFDLWHPDEPWFEEQLMYKDQWKTLRNKIMEWGVVNSLLIAPMPTASTSQILGNNECIEPFTSNIYVRRVLSGEFTVINKHLVADLEKLDLWSPAMKNRIIADHGSVQGILEIPEYLRLVYRTVWEIRQTSLVDMAADRGKFIDQSQSLNIFIAEPTFAKLTTLHFYAWKKGLKTGMYYLRTQPAANAIQFTVDPQKQQQTEKMEEEEEKGDGGESCRMNEGCVTCSS